MNLPQGVKLESGRGGLRRLAITTALAEAEIYLHGAHVAHFQPRGQEPLLFLSAQSWFETGRPVRGGVPVCFPWFGSGQDGKQGASHGFARLREWKLVGAETASDGSVELRFHFASDEETRKQWDGDFEVDYAVRIGAALGMQLRVRNTFPKPICFEEALHTYLAVSDVREVSIEGLANTDYLTTVGTPRKETEGAAPIRITAETDRIYLNTQSACVVTDATWQRRLIVEKTGSHTTVLWNPWIEKSKRMPDFGDVEWPRMLCIESCNVRDYAVTLEPDQTHAMTATVRVESDNRNP